MNATAAASSQAGANADGYEDSLLAAVGSGRQLRYSEGAPAKPTAERMLAVQTGLLRDAAERNPALGELDLDAALERLEHEWPAFRGLRVHLEVHLVGDALPTFVLVPGLGDHVRRHLPLAAALAEHGHNVIGVDRQGHGLSEGARGDAPLEADLGVLELAIRRARELSTGPVVLLGDSLGGIMTWYLLTREPDIDAAVCHCIAHPDVQHDPSFRVKAPLTRAVARVAPRLPVPVGQVADYDHVAIDPETKRQFDERLDPLFSFTVTARAAASYLSFRPQIPWEAVQTPVLVLIGGEDRMVTPAFTREAFERATPPIAELRVIAGAGHQLFLDDLGQVLPALLEWSASTLSG
jgi:alpha-beta hydrolase superfamily lysophospholipase